MQEKAMEPPKRNAEARDKKSDLLAKMSHEVRTPLNVVVGLANILQVEGHSPQKQREFLKTLQLNAEHLASMINTLIDLAKMEAEEVERNKVYFDLALLQKESESLAIPLEQEYKKSFRVLVVEDVRPNMLVTTTYLKLFGYNYDIALNGREALEMMRHKHYGLILMDIQMPEMDGFEATEAIRKLETAEGRAKTPIIGMTACAMEGDREKCFISGMDNYIPKPFKAEDLKNMLKSYTSE